MDKKLFREKSVEKISAPEHLNEYIKVIKFRMWPVFIVLILMLTSVLFWIDSKNSSIYLRTAGQCENGVLTCYVKEEDYDDLLRLQEHIVVCTVNKDTFSDEYNDLISISEKPVELDDKTDSYLLHISDFEDDEWAYVVTWQTNLPDGVYKTLIYGNKNKTVR